MKTLTVEQLIKQLKEFNPDDKVLFSSDEEGNNLHATLELGLTDVDTGKEKDETFLVFYPLNDRDNDIN